MCKQVKMERCDMFVFICFFVLISATGFTSISAIESIDKRNAPTDTDSIWNCRYETKYVLNKTALSWSRAYIACLQNGMELAIIKSKEEEEALEAELTNYNITKGITHGYWIGGTRNGSPNDTYLWFATGEYMLYRNFPKGQPDKAGGAEACVHIYSTNDNQILWNDWICMNKIGFVCQARKRVTNCCCGL